jgi:hypothetical protein
LPTKQPTVTPATTGQPNSAAKGINTSATPQLASNSEIDVDKYVGYIHSTFDQVLEALGLDFNKIIELTKLERFM